MGNIKLELRAQEDLTISGAAIPLCTLAASEEPNLQDLGRRIVLISGDRL